MAGNDEVPTIEGLDTLPKHVRDLFYENPQAQDQDGNTVIHIHIMRDKYYPLMTPRLIAQATNLEIKNKCGLTAFLFAIVRRNKSMIQALIEAGANVHTTCNLKCNVLHYIAWMARKDIDGCMDRPLSRRPKCSLFPFLESFLQKGVDVNLQNTAGSTPLMWAAHEDNLKIVKLLLKFGANVHLTDADSRTCLHKVSTSLVDFSSLHFLSPSKNSDIMTELILNGACVNCLDNKNRTPLGCILKAKHSNKKYFARKFLTAACLAHWEIRNDFYILRNRILGRFRADRSLVQHVDACYKEIGRMKSFQLSKKYNLCQFALRGMSDAEESIASERKDAALNILVRETFPIYHDFIFSNFQLDYFQEKLTELDIFTYRTGQKISLIPDVTRHLASFLDLNDLFNAFKAYSEATLR